MEKEVNYLRARLEIQEREIESHREQLRKIMKMVSTLVQKIDSGKIADPMFA